MPGAPEPPRRHTSPSPRSEQRHRTTGLLGEELAAEHLRRRGFQVLARNVRTAAGEIDVIASNGCTIAFVEVKTTRGTERSTGNGSSAGALAAIVLERLGPRQRRRLRGLALDWLRAQPTARRSAEELRFDAIGVVLDDAGRLLALEHLEGAW
ncbi:MAG TPA: YraN family protein [Solirubrobacteraceae bacterium]